MGCLQEGRCDLDRAIRRQRIILCTRDMTYHTSIGEKVLSDLVNNALSHQNEIAYLRFGKECSICDRQYHTSQDIDRFMP